MGKAEISFSAEKKKTLVIGSSEFISSNDFSLTEEEIKKARQELSETEEKKLLCIRELRNKLEKDEDIHYRTDGDYLLRYLRVRKFDCDKAYKNIKASYSFRKKYKEFLRIPSNLESLLKLNFYTYLPYIDENGRILAFSDLEKWNYAATSFPEILQCSHSVLDIITSNPRCQVNGAIMIWDMKELNRHHLAAVVRKISLRSLSFFLEAYYPVRLKNIYIVNTGRLTQMLYKLLRPFVSKKIYDRVLLFGSDLSELHQHVNPALLPKVLGGSLEEDQYDVTQNILDNLSYLEYEKSFS